MKKLFKAGLLAFILTLAYSAADAQIYVNIRPRPQRVVVRRPPQPSPSHIWVKEDWRPQGKRYQWSGGYWAAPPRPRAVYVPGHWSRTRRGNVWVSATWR